MALVMEDISTDLVKVLAPSDEREGVAILQLNRPQKRNAFTQEMIDAMVKALDGLDKNRNVRALVVTSAPKSPFSAGMDLKELVEISTAEAYQRQFLKDLTDAFGRFSKPSIAAVNGFAFGGGFEIALACDMIYAAENALLGLPEIKIGTIPGAGGTQRLTRALGKQKAIEFILTGASATAAEFERLGLVNKVFPPSAAAAAADDNQEDDVVVAEATRLATRIAAMSGPVVVAAKQAVLAAEVTPLDAGLQHEKALYYSTFGTHDCKEGLTAFLEKRAPAFTHR